MTTIGRTTTPVAPVDAKISQHFGESHEWSPDPHSGIDYVVKSGTEVHAALGGRVQSVSRDGSEGIRVRIRQDDGTVATYAHLGAELVGAVGSRVDQGDVIARSGQTGMTTGPCLHFGISRAGVKIDPEAWLAGTSVAAETAARFRHNV